MGPLAPSVSQGGLQGPLLAGGLRGVFASSFNPPLIPPPLPPTTLANVGGVWPDNPPIIRVLDVDGDGRDDVLFQTGGGGSPSGTPGSGVTMELFTAPSTAGGIVAHPLSTWTTPQSHGAYQTSGDAASGGDRQALQNVVPLDIDGDGTSEILVNQASVNAAQTAIQCQNKVLHWKDAATGFVDTGLVFAPYDCTNPYRAGQTNLFLDIDGDHLLDQVQAPDAMLNAGTQPIDAEIPGAFGVMRYNLTNYGDHGFSDPAPWASAIWASCPVYVVDFSGDGRGQLFGQSGAASATTAYAATCGTLNADATALDTYDPTSGQWHEQVDADPLNDTDINTNPSLPIIPDSTYLAAGGALGRANRATVPGLGTNPDLIFGDFNGDGLEDVLEPDQDPANAGKGIYWLRWNTGNGFGPRQAQGFASGWAAANPGAAAQRQDTSLLLQQAPIAPSFFKIVPVDVNRDGRTDLVIFQNYSYPSITVLLSNGDGTFHESTVRTGLASFDDPGIVDTNGNWVVGVGDFNGDGYPDLIRLEATDPDWYANGGISTTTPTNLQYLTAAPPTLAPDRIIAVSDEGSAWPREQVTYSLQASDKPEAVVPCTYPVHCDRKAFWVVRELDSRSTLADVQSVAQIDSGAHRLYYSYEDPVSDLKGRGFLGFRKVREWDPVQPRQTITLYDNRSTSRMLAANNAAPTGYFYPGALRPQQQTTVVAIPATGSLTLPTVGNPRTERTFSSANARVTQTTFTYLPSSFAGTFVVAPYSTKTQEWEQTVMMDAVVTDTADPTSDYIWNTNASPAIAAPTTPLRTTTSTINSYDSTYGNVLKRTDTVAGGTQRVTVSNYTNNPSTWQIGQLNWTSTTTTQNGVSATQQSSYSYDPATGLLQTANRLEQETAQTDPTAIALGTPVTTTTLGRDDEGNVTSILTTATVPNAAPLTRQLNIEYDALWPGQPNERVFPSQEWMPNVQPGPNGTTWQPSAWSLIHPAYGVVVATLDANGIQTVANLYDDQGRLRRSTPTGGATVSIDYAPRPDLYTGTTNGIITTTRSATGETSTISGDADGRPLVVSHTGFDGTTINDRQITYDVFGRTNTVSRPYQSAAPDYLGGYTFDGLNRLLEYTAPDSTNQRPVLTTHAPTFFTDTTTDPNGNQTTITYDVDGEIVSSSNLLNGAWVTTRFARTPLLSVATDPKNNTETTQFDALGRVTGHTDADTGTITNMIYDGFDQLLGSTHQPSGVTTTNVYDVLGRRMSATSTDGPTSETFVYDTQPYGRGKLARATSSDNVTTVPNYDISGRLTGVTETIDGQTYSIGWVFNALGQISQSNYPSLPGHTAPGIALLNAYNAAGYLKEVDVSQDGAAMPLPPLWRVQSRNLDDALLRAVFGNSVHGFAGAGKPAAPPTQLAVTIQNSYDPASGHPQQLQATTDLVPQALLNLTYAYYANGLVQTRTDAVNGRAEAFGYDSLNRLTTWNLSAAACTAAPCAPPATAASWQKYDYDTTGNLSTVSKWATIGKLGNWSALQTNIYNTNGGGPHALSAQTTASGTTNYFYDTQGRQTHGLQTLTYNAFDLPRSVASGGVTWNLRYDAFGQRVEKSRQDGSESVVYVGAGYEKRTTSLGSIDVYHVPSGQLEYNEATGTMSQYGTFADALGSISTVYTPNTMTGVASFYDPFGARINSNGTPFSGGVGEITQGFTGQEHDDDFGLINFRGRLYNPTLKRFVSADPHVTSPTFGQSWNPYSYVNNSPLNRIDPSGFDGFDDMGPTPTTAGPAGSTPGGTTTQTGVTYPNTISNLPSTDSSAPPGDAIGVTGAGESIGQGVSAIPQQSGAAGFGDASIGSFLMGPGSANGLVDRNSDSRLAALSRFGTEEECRISNAKGIRCLVYGSAMTPFEFALGTIGEFGVVLSGPMKVAPSLFTRFTNLFRSEASIAARAVAAEIAASKAAVAAAQNALAAASEKLAAQEGVENLARIRVLAGEEQLKRYTRKIYTMKFTDELEIQARKTFKNQVVSDAIGKYLEELAKAKAALKAEQASTIVAREAVQSAEEQYKIAARALRDLVHGPRPSSIYRGDL